MQRNNFYSYTQKKLDLLTKNLLVIKRDGRIVKFDADKIYKAIEKAVNSVFGEKHSININNIVDNVIIEIGNRFKDNIKIYELQNIVEHTLLTLGEEAIYEIPELSKLVLQLKFQYEALKINQTLGDTNRVVECLANMITTVEEAINPGESDDDEDNIENEVDEGLSYNEVDNALKTLDLSIEAILSLHQQLLVENTMLDTALEQYFEFDDLSGYDFADEYIIPSVKSSVEQIVQNIDNPILTNYVNSLLAVKNPF